MLMILGLSFVGFLLIGVPVAVALGASSALAVALASHVPLLVVAQKIFQGMNNFSFLAIPLFLLAGSLMAEARISERLVALANLMLGRYPGGLANVATASSAFFGSISGSAPATTAAVGSVMIPSMVKRGYRPQDAAAVVAASGALGLIIPPSLTMVIYGVISGVSIGDLFVNGVLPGLMLTFALMALNYAIAKRKMRKGKNQEQIDIEKAQAGQVIRNSLLALLMPFIIIVGIYSGAFTATESAAIACFYGLFLGVVVYRTLSWKGLVNAFKSTATNTAIIMFLMACANAFAYVITAERVPQQFALWLVSITNDPIMIMLLMLVLLLIVGTFLDNVSALVLLVPTLMSIISAVNIDPLYFGVFTIIALAVGQFTPPVGLNLFIGANIAKQKVEPVALAVLPYLFVYLLMLLVFIFVPSLLVVSQW
ncbi:TRAP transporter large permease [Alcaligenes endophyticus]|uniref:TRAP transporter large permease protein n=1 Tax=Alcaligenes endophyticus TaxID=1929088 RepID=A0ABT8EI73_9BURK|nr:TRAP transporter large permease [Alcaligenes endophyticus]MCX5592663.1 TRAP transporter large permease [Alcaligenes endophyticus]MDN4120989.1 TRAP transporter large permease [Alcaligenes endophyticus]